MKIANLTRLSIMVILAMSLSLGLSSCGKDDTADPTTTNNNNTDPDPDPVVKQKLTIWVLQGSGADEDPIPFKDVKLATSISNLDQNILIGTKETNPQGTVDFEVEPGTYYFRTTVAGGPLGTKTASAIVEEGFDADGFIRF